MQIAIAQLNPIVGDLTYNKSIILDAIRKAKKARVDLLVMPEMVLMGYPIHDLVFHKDYLHTELNYLFEIINETNDIAIVVGGIDKDSQYNTINCAYLIQNGQLLGKAIKSLLPTYDVFHEKRHFLGNENPRCLSLMIKNKLYKLGIEICEDLWDETYPIKVTDNLVLGGADIIINISASPYTIGKHAERQKLVEEQVAKHKVPFIYCNLVGAQDEIIFDGSSFVYNAKGQKIIQLTEFAEDFAVVNPFENSSYQTNATLSDTALTYHALVLGIKDYFKKNNLTDAIIGLSGGVDSALVTCLAVEALGANKVHVLSLPSKYSSQHSLDDAKKLAENLKIDYRVIPIEAYHTLFNEHYSDYFPKESVGLADENLQARLRGLILMLFSNQKNYCLLSTGNKTEIALGYCTLYGDMNGAISVIGDLNKTRVYEMCEYINNKAGMELIPKQILEKIPSAELKDNQFDPFDYPLVAPLVDQIIEQQLSKNDCLKLGYKAELLDDIYRRLYSNEFKRFQSNIILKVTAKAFGTGRMYPITNHYRG